MQTVSGAVVARAFNPSTQEVEAGVFEAKPGLHRDQGFRTASTT